MGQTSLPESLHMAVEENAVPEGRSEVSRAQWWLSKSSRSSTPKTGFDLTVLSSPNVSMYYRYQQPWIERAAMIREQLTFRASFPILVSM